MTNVADLFEYFLARDINDACVFDLVGTYQIEATWALPTNERPNRRSRKIHIDFARPLVEIFEEANEDRQDAMAIVLRKAVGKQLGTYDPEDSDNVPFKVNLTTDDAGI